MTADPRSKHSENTVVVSFSSLYVVNGKQIRLMSAKFINMKLVWRGKLNL